MGAPTHSDLLEGQTLNVDGASNNKGSKIKIILTTPEGTIIEQSYTLGFPATNNEAKYEAVIAGLRMAAMPESLDSRFTAVHYWW